MLVFPLLWQLPVHCTGFQKSYVAVPRGEALFRLQLEPFLVKGRTLLGSMENPRWKGFKMKPKMVLPRTKKILPGTKKVSSKGYPMGTVEEPF